MIQGIANALPAMSPKVAAVASSLFTLKVAMIAAAALATVGAIYYAAKYLSARKTAANSAMAYTSANSTLAYCSAQKALAQAKAQIPRHPLSA